MSLLIALAVLFLANDRKKMTKHTVASLKSILTSIRAHDTKNIDFPVVIEAFYNKKMIKISQSADDIALVSSLHSALNACVQAVNQKPILSKRPNEVGNYIEQPVIDAINATHGLSADKPSNAQGNKQSTGYPDILVWDSKNRPTYLEVKTYNIKKKYRHYPKVILSIPIR